MVFEHRRVYECRAILLLPMMQPRIEGADILSRHILPPLHLTESCRRVTSAVLFRVP